MWNRAELKERAKAVLRKHYWAAFAVTLVAAILGATFAVHPFSVFGYRMRLGNFPMRPMNGWNGNWNGGWNWNRGWDGSGLQWDNPALSKVLLAVLVGGAIVSVIALIALAVRFAWRIFVSGPAETGMDRYFLDARQDRSDFTTLFHSFRGGRYLGVVKAIAWRELFLFLWSLLFVIPGWIKGYSYSMIPYLLAENPGMDYKRAMKLSMAMTHGHKWDIFVLDLSFLGWFLLGLLCCGLGVLFLNPYAYATKAELYTALRQHALDTGLCSREELGLEPAPAA